ncbi:metal-dependent transcriptional regulator [Halomicrobium urmianum]|uniref:metal-dependent transcriptional regulator n=1 Tax=Halomicrobium urmianum TaxID=1586233 RepID=UPI001CD9EC6F|nr:metal-dependent transcriptional regulator [Halomicrobium urmianum]
MLSATMEDYLKALYRLQRDEEGPVSTSALADALDVTPPTASSSLEKLEDRGFVEREKYAGARLSPEGETVALEVIRHHRLLETYLTEYLGYDWAEVHDEADRLEHHISEEFERRVAAALDDPKVDPHGDPIPSETLEPVDEEPPDTLGEHGVSDVLVVERVSDRDPEELAYLSERGIAPGTELTVVDVAPIGMVTVEVDGEEVALPDRIAGLIHVRTADREATA